MKLHWIKINFIFRHLSLAHNTLTTISEGELGVNKLIQELSLEDNIITQANDLPGMITR